MARPVAAVLAAKVTGAASRALGRGGGTALPGLVAERLDPEIVARLARRLGQGAAIVTGTNGKTTTSRMLAGILGRGGVPVLHNRSGSNLMRGLAATLTAAAGLDGHIRQGERTAGVFEVDEATLPGAVQAVRPRAVAFTNLFRDQLDRYGEVDSIIALWRRGLIMLPASSTVILNADDPSVAALRRIAPGRVLTYGVDDAGVTGGVEEHPADARWCSACGTEFVYRTRFFWHVGHWRCPGCGDARPTPDVTATRVTSEQAGTTIDVSTPAGKLAVRLPLAGLYNVYNSLAAAAAALAMGAGPEAIGPGLESFTAAFGRQETLRVRGREVQVLLCKNPAGVNQVLRTMLASLAFPAAADLTPLPPSLADLPPRPPSPKGRGSIAGDSAGPVAASNTHTERRADSAGEGATVLPSPFREGGRGGRSLHLLLVLNDGIADGRDVSWIWDVDYELLAEGAALVVASGTRAADLALRLKYAGLSDRLVLEPDPRAAVSRALAGTPEGGRLHVLPTYTAMLTVREHLASLAGRPRFWKQ